MTSAFLRVVNENPVLSRFGARPSRGVEPSSAVQLLRGPGTRGIEKLQIELRTRRLSLAEALDLHDAIARLERAGVLVSAHSSRLDLAHLLAVSSAAARSCSSLSGPIRAELTLGHLDLSKPLAAIGLRINTAISGIAKSQGVLVDSTGLSEAARDAEALWLAQTLDLVLGKIAERLGYEIEPGEVIPTGAEAVKLGLLSAMSELPPNRDRGRAIPCLPPHDGVALRLIRPMHLARESGLQAALGDLRGLARNDAIGAVVMVLDVAGMATSLADRWFSSVRRLAQTKPIVSYARVATSGGLLPLVAGTRAVASPFARLGAAGAIAYEIDRAGIPFWTSVRAPAGEVSAGGSLQRRADIAAGLLNARIAEARNLQERGREQVSHGALMTARQAHEYGLIDQVGTLWSALEVAHELAGADPARIRSGRS
jgi:hypothetical protein